MANDDEIRWAEVLRITQVINEQAHTEFDLNHDEAAAVLRRLRRNLLTEGRSLYQGIEKGEPVYFADDGKLVPGDNVPPDPELAVADSAADPTKPPVAVNSTDKPRYRPWEELSQRERWEFLTTGEAALVTQLSMAHDCGISLKQFRKWIANQKTQKQLTRENWREKLSNELKTSGSGTSTTPKAGKKSGS